MIVYQDDDIIDEIRGLGCFAGVFRWVLMYAEKEELQEIKRFIEQELYKYENRLDRKRITR